MRLFGHAIILLKAGTKMNKKGDDFDLERDSKIKVCFIYSLREVFKKTWKQSHGHIWGLKQWLSQWYRDSPRSGFDFYATPAVQWGPLSFASWRAAEIKDLLKPKELAPQYN